jgi:UDP-N-acetylglucosamine 4,6-dehydratase
MGSRGSVIPFFKSLAERGEPLPITDLRMTRFWITLPQAVEFVVNSFDQMHGGELYVPRIPSMRLVDLARVIAPNSPMTEVGIRPGEKLHEEMIAPDDSRRTLLLDDRYIVMPHIAGWGYEPPADGKPVPEGFAYRSDTNDLWLSDDDLRTLVDQYG